MPTKTHLAARRYKSSEFFSSLLAFSYVMHHGFARYSSMFVPKLFPSGMNPSERAVTTTDGQSPVQMKRRLAIRAAKFGPEADSRSRVVGEVPTPSNVVTGWP